MFTFRLLAAAWCCSLVEALNDSSPWPECENSCAPRRNCPTCPISSQVNDGWCDDGGAGAEFAYCELGTDCVDCGIRSNTPPCGPGAPSCPPHPPPPDDTPDLRRFFLLVIYVLGVGVFLTAWKVLSQNRRRQSATMVQA